jgi:hypothetical protein
VGAGVVGSGLGAVLVVSVLVGAVLVVSVLVVSVPFTEVLAPPEACTTPASGSVDDPD